MTLRVVTAATAEPVTLAEAKKYLRVDVTDDDTLITALITAAREHVEHASGRSWATQTLELTFEEFGGALELEQGPVTAITSIKYIDTSGVERTLGAGEYVLRGEIVQEVDAWPATYATEDAVKVRYTVGETVIPQAVKTAILVMLAHLYENRENAGEIPTTVRRLLNGVKVY